MQRELDNQADPMTNEKAAFKLNTPMRIKDTNAKGTWQFG